MFRLITCHPQAISNLKVIYDFILPDIVIVLYILYYSILYYIILYYTVEPRLSEIKGRTRFRISKISDNSAPINFSQQTDVERLRGVLRQPVLGIAAPYMRQGILGTNLLM